MRVNVYDEELGEAAAVVKKTADTGRTFYGVRFFLKSAPELHDTPDDDDRSAVTIWYGNEEVCLEVMAAHNAALMKLDKLVVRH